MRGSGTFMSTYIFSFLCCPDSMRGALSHSNSRQLMSLLILCSPNMNYAVGAGVWYRPLESKLTSEAEKRKRKAIRAQGAIRLLAPSLAFDCARHSTQAMTRVQRSRG